MRVAGKKSLAELGTDSVDTSYLHAADRRVPLRADAAGVPRAVPGGQIPPAGTRQLLGYNCVTLVVHNPIAGGRFSDKNQTRPARCVAAATSVPRERSPPWPSTGMGLSLLETALRRCVHHSKLQVLDGSDGVIVGVGASDQLKADLDALEKGPLPEDDR
ncbi:hypothetical protein FN846DRAFT_907180 [Sphaerosporella brunnea]|uniref:Uncharacterized protein n=1 Tax=Sphaerosporella brunnea TaxID=1250544 RepID=A0A5J5EXW6_9PEZI|nr:hypothetical protein FN846DRAFT_907180 [Sphaerosporella brunnea]